MKKLNTAVYLLGPDRMPEGTTRDINLEIRFKNQLMNYLEIKRYLGKCYFYSNIGLLGSEG